MVVAIRSRPLGLRAAVIGASLFVAGCFSAALACAADAPAPVEIARR